MDVAWNRQPGLGLYIAGNAQGSLWVVGVDEVTSGNYSIHQYAGDPGSEWRRQPGAGRRIAVDARGDVWMVDAQNYIFRYTTQTGLWERLPGLGQDIAAGGDGSVWLVGTGPVAGGYGIYKWNGSGWTEFSGGAMRIAVERNGSPWVVNDAGDVYRYNTQSRSWEQKRAGARSVHAGALSGAVWVIDAGPVADGFPIQQWNAANNSWEPFGDYGAVAVTEVKGTPWIVQSDGGIYSAAPPSPGPPIGIPIHVDGPVMPPMTPANIPVVVQPSATGKLLCSAVDTGSYSYCGNTKADYVGAYSLNLKCAAGFYDPIYGGTCWKCPNDDGNGEWIRSADAVEKDTACWRVPKETLSAATKVKSPAWAWDCPSGSFWDGFSPDGIGGSCWQCPDSYPRRTANAVWSDQACASPVNQTSPATLLTFNGCPKPDAERMGLPGKRSPGKPFLDIGAGWNQGSISGGCFACPVVDESGNFLITARNSNPIYEDNNAGCRINFKWQPPQFPEPGLAGLRGVKEVIWENRLFEQDRITSSLYFQAQSRGLDKTSPEARAWVAARWKEIAARPYNSEAFRLDMFAVLQAALAKTESLRTPGEQMLIRSFQDYIVRRRTYLAEQALAMYDAWKRYSDDARASRAQSRLDTMFYYGTVPLDFNAMLGSTIAVGGTGSALIGSMVAYHSFRTLTQAAGTEGLFYYFGGKLALLLTTQALTALSGASIIGAVGAILSSIALDQFMEIEGARPKLEASLATAKQPVSLDPLIKEPNGEDLLYYYWGKAMDIQDQEDQQVVDVATAACAFAEQKGFPLPQ
jgi:hypothetical protein